MNKNYTYKSTEEKWFSWYLDELKEYGLIENYTYEEVTFTLAPKQTFKYDKQLKTKVKSVEKILFRPLTYTPDFVINFETKATSIANLPHKFPLFITSNSTLTAYIDIKGGFGNKASDIRFPDKQKMMYHLHRIYVNKIEIEANPGKQSNIFKETFLPKKIIEECVYLKDCYWGKKGESKIKYKYHTIEEWIKTL